MPAASILAEQPLSVLRCLFKSLLAQNGAVTVCQVAVKQSLALPPVGLAMKPQLVIDPSSRLDQRPDVLTRLPLAGWRWVGL